MPGKRLWRKDVKKDVRKDARKDVRKDVRKDARKSECPTTLLLFRMAFSPSLRP